MTKHRKILSCAALVGVAWALTGLAASDSSRSAQPETGRDGSHDFDFLYGKWKMPNHRLTKRLAGSHEWVDFITCDEASPLPGGLGDIDYLKASYWKDFVGMTVRTYDPKTGLWRIYWVETDFLKASFSRRSSANSKVMSEYSKDLISLMALRSSCGSHGR